MKLAIVCRPENKSPKVLAQSLKQSLDELSIDSKIFYDIGFLHRNTPLFETGMQYRSNWHFKLRQRLKYYFYDRKIIKELKTYDAVVLSECIPNAYWKNYYGLPQLKRKIGKPLGLYEVFFLDSSPRFLKEIEDDNPNYKSLFDFEFAITTTSYIKTSTSPTKFEIGLNLKSSNIAPVIKEELTAIVDFYWNGCDEERTIQMEALNEVGIKIIELKGSYTVEEIRDLYKKSSLLFIQHFESFGLPIAECLGYGAKVVTPHSGWPMAFRKGENIKEYQTGELAECFISYKDKADLISKLIQYKNDFDNIKTAKNNFDIFYSNYPHFYEGSKRELKRFQNEFSK